MALFLVATILFALSRMPEAQASEAQSIIEPIPETETETVVAAKPEIEELPVHNSENELEAEMVVAPEKPPVVVRERTTINFDFSGTGLEPFIFADQAENAVEYYIHMRRLGFNHASTCAIMGNVMCECRFYPDRGCGMVCKMDWVGFDGQLHGAVDFKRWAEQTGYDLLTVEGCARVLHWSITSGEDTSINPEVFLSGDLQPGYRCTKEEFMNTTLSVDIAADLFCVAYERCFGGTDASITAGNGQLYQACWARREYAKIFSKALEEFGKSF